MRPDERYVHYQVALTWTRELLKKNEETEVLKSEKHRHKLELMQMQFELDRLREPLQSKSRFELARDVFFAKVQVAEDMYGIQLKDRAQQTLLDGKYPVCLAGWPEELYKHVVSKPERYRSVGMVEFAEAWIAINLGRGTSIDPEEAMLWMCGLRKYPLSGSFFMMKLMKQALDASKIDADTPGGESIKLLKEFMGKISWKSLDEDILMKYR